MNGGWGGVKTIPPLAWLKSEILNTQPNEMKLCPDLKYH